MSDKVNMADNKEYLLDGFQPSLRPGFPAWVVLRLDEGDAMITCPETEGRCGNTAIVHYETWLTCSKSLTRSCTYCFKASGLPRMTITPSHEVPE